MVSFGSYYFEDMEYDRLNRGYNGVSKSNYCLKFV